MANFICTCGYIGNQRHAGHCETHRQEIDRIENNIKKYLLNEYNKNFSVSECCKIVKQRENTLVSESIIRRLIDNQLKKYNVKQGISGKMMNIKRQEKIKETMIKKYGVINAGQLDGNGFKKQNQIPYNKLSLLDSITEYREKVGYLTDKMKSFAIKNNLVPECCEYTGIRFADSDKKEVNPNDPFKRTIDHKVPIVEAYLLGWSAEKTADIDNIAWCLRAVNTIKGNSNIDQFNKILPFLKKNLYENL